MISYFDEQIGKLIEKLKKERLYDNTVIMFTSDNGPTLMVVAIRRGSTVEVLSGLSMVGENVLFTKEEYVSLLLSPGPGKSNRLPRAIIFVDFRM